MKLWKKIGFFEVPRGLYPWMCSHAQLPTPLPLCNDRVRVFFASRTEDQKSHVAYTDLVLLPEKEAFLVDQISTEPVLYPGPCGNFDEHGVYPSSVIQYGGKYYLYYIGWNRGVEAPLFYASIGLAVSEDGVNFEKESVAPLLARSEHDPCLVTSPHVYVDNGRWRMLYVSGVKWSRDLNGRLQSHYHIKLAEGTSPHDWMRDGRVAIDFAPGETNIARSAVIRDAVGKYQMWFSYVHSSIGTYRIGYADSEDGLLWQRNDQCAGVSLDDEHCRKMACYPAVFEHSGYRYMLYNGDRYGQEGFCVAVLAESARERL